MQRAELQSRLCTSYSWLQSLNNGFTCKVGVFSLFFPPFSFSSNMHIRLLCLTHIFSNNCRFMGLGLSESEGPDRNNQGLNAGTSNLLGFMESKRSYTWHSIAPCSLIAHWARSWAVCAITSSPSNGFIFNLRVANGLLKQLEQHHHQHTGIPLETTDTGFRSAP